MKYTDGSREDAHSSYLRAWPHMLLDEDTGEIIALSNGFQPTKASQYVRTIVVQVMK